jgi:non-canonical (house-cleaning) NTP pyrophosphatase
VGDPKQPRTQRRIALAALQRGKRARQRRLERVLGVGIVVQDRTAVAIQVLVIALVDRRERPLAPVPDEPR